MDAEPEPRSAQPRTALVVSSRDEAGVTIREALVSLLRQAGGSLSPLATSARPRDSTKHLLPQPTERGLKSGHLELEHSYSFAGGLQSIYDAAHGAETAPEEAGTNPRAEETLSRSSPEPLPSAEAPPLFFSLFTVKPGLIWLDSPEKLICADRFIFLSKHASRSGIPTLTVHSIGNWGPSDFGGRPGTLVPTIPGLMKLALLFLKKCSEPISYEAVQEATHHGPYSAKPTLFVEIGSAEREWRDERAAAQLAKALMMALVAESRGFSLQRSSQYFGYAPAGSPESGGEGESRSFPSRPCDFIPAVGLGGPHTMPNFEKVSLGSEYCIAYSCAKHNLQYLAPEILMSALGLAVGCEKNWEKARPASSPSSTNQEKRAGRDSEADFSSEKAGVAIILDWKGLGKEKSRVLEVVEAVKGAWNSQGLGALEVLRTSSF